MQVTKEIQERFLLEVNREEAEWLIGEMQQISDNEDDREMRSRYFHAMDRVLSDHDNKNEHSVTKIPMGPSEGET